ncbi:MAG: decaprenyl-phosphate phosphoribosyltransferase [Polyangiales bacterium]
MAARDRTSSPEVAARGGLVAGLIKTIRPHQWVKNLFVLAPVFFAKDAFHPQSMLRALAGAGVFCILSGAVYTLNDLIDVDADRVHPVKRNRPIASGQVPVAIARGWLVALLLVAFAAAAIFFRPAFAGVALGYFLLNVAYSLRLKKVPFIDVACIAGGFVLRVLGGGFAIGVHVSEYMLACTALLALFLGFGKRRHEIAQEHAGKQRASLESYTARGLDAALLLTGLPTIAVYVAYTLDADTRAFFKTDQLWMTTPSVVLGVARFVQIVKGHPKSESPTQEMLRDGVFVLNLILWAAVVLVIVYRIRPTASP